MTDFFSTRFAHEPIDSPEPSATFIADLRHRLEEAWSDDGEAHEMVMTQERPTKQAPGGRGPRRWQPIAIAAAAAAIVAAVVGVVVVRDDDSPTRIVDQPSTTTTTAPPKVVGAIDNRLIADGSVFQMVGTDSDLWRLTGDDLERMDPVTGAHTKVLHVADGRAGTEDAVDDAIVSANGSLVLALHRSGIVQVAGDGSRIIRRVDVPTLGASRGMSIAVGRDAVWGIVDRGQAIVRVDLATGAVSDPIHVADDEFRQLAFDGTSLYAAMYHGVGKEILRKLDPATYEVRGELTLPDYLSRGMLLAAGTLWVSGDVDSSGAAVVAGVDVVAMKIRTTVMPPGRYGQAMVERDGIIWVGMHESGSLTGIDASTGAVTRTIPFDEQAGGAESLAVAPDGSMWAWEPPNGTVLRFTFTG